MWSNLSNLAQHAKDAAALIEGQINDSLKYDDDDDEAADGERRSRGTSDGWEKCDDDISSDEGKGGEKANRLPDKSSELSFVDLKAAAADIPKNPSGELETDPALLEALAKIDILEKQVNSLKDELAGAREEAANHHSTLLLQRERIEELEKENRSLKESSEGGNEEQHQQFV